MTIVASVKVRDGLVLATDSMTQISVPTDQGPQFLKSYSNARKLFQVTDAVGAMTYGLGNIGNRSVEGIVLDYVMGTEPAESVEAVSQELFDYVKQQYDGQLETVPEQDRPLLGFYIAGYPIDGQFSEAYEFLLPRDTGPIVAFAPDGFGASWRGVDAPFTRLYKGFDAYVIPPRLEGVGVSAENIEAVFNPEGLETAVLFDGMPVQDAINFAVYILETTIGWATFAVGVPSCGGPLQVATILNDEGFRWVSRPEPHIPRSIRP